MENNKCSACGGFFEYSPKDKALKCKQCGKLTKIKNEKTLQQHEFDNLKSKEKPGTELKNIKCSNCGANVYVDKYSIISKCSYCGSTSLSVSENKAGIEPDAVLPFQFDVEKSKEYFHKNIKEKWFVPSVLKKQTPDLHVTPRYVSTYLFVGDLVAHYDGVLEFTEDEESNGEVKTVVTTKHVVGDLPHNFNYVIEASRNLSQWELEKIMPYDMAQLQPYSVDYLYGHSAEYSDKTVNEANTELERILKSDIEDRVQDKYDADSVRWMNVSFSYNKRTVQYCLLPAYMFNYDYKKKNYKTLMNGQSGKLGGGVPRSGLKITLFVLMILGVVGLGIIFILMTMGVI